METPILIRFYRIIDNAMTMSISFVGNELQVKFEVDNREIHRFAITREPSDLLETILPVICPEICRVLLNNMGLDNVSISVNVNNCESVMRFASFVKRFLDNLIDVNAGVIYETLRSHRTT